MLPLLVGTRSVRAMLEAPGVAEQRECYARHWDNARWRGVFRLCFGRRLLAAFGRHRRLFAGCEIENVGAHYLRRLEVGLTTIPIKTNPYLTYMLAGEYDHPCRMPVYLHPASLVTIQAMTNRVTVRHESLATVLRDLPDDSMDAFYLSDVFEGFAAADYEEALEQIARVGRPGARLVYWNNLAPRSRPERMRGLIDTHPDLAAGLYRQDRAFLYSRLVVESVKAG